MTHRAIVCNLSAHSVPANPLWLAHLVKPIRSGAAEASFGRQIPFKGVNPWEEYYLETLFPPFFSPQGRVSFSNANCAFKRGLWEYLKFDENIARWEDYLWYYLLNPHCRFIYCPEAIVYHSHIFNLREFTSTCRKDGMAARYFFTQHGINLWRDTTPAVADKIWAFISDILNHGIFLMKKNYRKEMFELPALKIAAYMAYFSGYKSRQRET